MVDSIPEVPVAGGKISVDVHKLLGLPNFLSLSRIFFLPFIALLLVKGLNRYALLLLAVAALTDALDGWLARRLHQVSRLGVMIDPVADKILYDGTALALALLKAFPLWAAITLLSRDFLVLAFVILVILKRRLLLSPVMIGKLASCGVAVTLLLFVAGVGQLGHILLWISLALVLISGLDYVLRFRRILAAAGVTGKSNGQAMNGR